MQHTSGGLGCCLNPQDSTAAENRLAADRRLRDQVLERVKEAIGMPLDLGGNRDRAVGQDELTAEENGLVERAIGAPDFKCEILRG